MAGPIVLPYPGATAGHTRTEYRRAIGQKLGMFRVANVVATAPSDDPDAAYRVRANVLRSDRQSPDRFNNRFVYVADGDQQGEQRRFIDGQHDDHLGSALVDTAYTSPLADQTEIEISYPLPSGDWGDYPSLNEIVDETLSQLWVRRRISFTGNGSYSYSLGAYPWLDSTERIVALVDSIGVPTGGNPTTAATAWRVRYQGDTRYLETDLSYQTTDTFEVETYQPANTLIRVNGSWGDADGFTADTDEAAAPVYLVRALGLALAYERLMTRAQWDDEFKPALATLEKNYVRWGKVAARLKWEMPRGTESTPLVSGSTGYAWGTKGLWP
jgi:hypothetical protein